ncbi:hypothetical protein GCM10027566_17820 [Arachidicoccus ginsenosidivorans]
MDIMGRLNTVSRRLSFENYVLLFCASKTTNILATQTLTDKTTFYGSVITDPPAIKYPFNG